MKRISSCFEGLKLENKVLTMKSEISTLREIGSLKS